jgi:hypothetical protein
MDLFEKAQQSKTDLVVGFDGLFLFVLQNRSP